MAAGAARAKVKTSDFDDVPARDAELFLIDGSSLAYRSFHALPQEIATSDGRPTNALLGFANMLVKLISDFDPRVVVVAWDVGGATERRKAYPEYKSQRPPMPDLLSEQWPHFHPLVEAFGFTNVSMPGHEADDVIGTLATRAAAAGTRTCIVTYDRDAMQLVDDDVVVLMTTKGVSETAAFTPERVHARYCVRPEQIPDFIALRGDTSDNIPGVPGVGDKTAADLLREFGTLEAVLGGLDRVTGTKRRENLGSHADQARMSRELATIVRDLPLDVDLADLATRPPDRSRLIAMCDTFEFRTLARRVTELELDGGAPRTAVAPAGPRGEEHVAQGELVAARLVSPHELRAVLDAAPERSGDPLPIVVRPLEGGAGAPDGVMAAVLVEEGVPDGGPTNRWVAAMRGDAATIVEAVGGRPLLAFDCKGLPTEFRRRTGSAAGDGRVVSFADDLLLATYLLQPGRRTFLLGEVLGEHGLTARIAFSSDDEELRECVAQAALLPALTERLLARLDDVGMRPLYRDIEMQVLDVLVDVEDVGISVDTYRLGEIGAKVADQLDELQERAWELAGREFTIGSPKQLAEVLFDELGLPAQRKGRTGYSTDARVLRDLRDMHPIIPVIEGWRELSKLRSTYLDTLPALVDARTGRIHTTFSQTTAATGRLSSVNPNLQNIPVRTPVGREIRSAFIPADGCRFVSCDYSQVELRLLAHVSGEPKLIETFQRGEDVHLATAAEVAGIEPAAVTREQRSAAKAINFGIIYGISSYGLSQQLQIGREQAQEYIDRYLGRYPHVSDFIERTVEFAREHGYVQTLFGRRRPIPELKSRAWNQRQLGERLAVNTVLQGTAADIMKVAMVRVHRGLRDQGMRSRIVLQIHDELLLESPEGEVRDTIALARREMSAAWQVEGEADRIPLEVEGGSGTSWLDAK